MEDVVGIIPAAGRGVRAYPFTRVIPKSLLEVDGITLIERNIAILRDQVGVSRIVIVLGHLGERIREKLGDGSSSGVPIEYVENDHLERELPYSLHLAFGRVHGSACVLLADECYLDSNHEELPGAAASNALVVCGLTKADSLRSVRANYAVERDSTAILRIEEKPARPTSLEMGTGTYLVSAEAQEELARTFREKPEGPGDWMSWIDDLARSSGRVTAFEVRGHYVNVNGRNELNHANHLARRSGIETRTTSLVYLSDQQEEAAGPAILPFAEAPEVNEVIAVSRCRTASLEGAAEHPKVRLVSLDRPEASVADLYLRGMDEASGEILVTTLSDDTFSPADLDKLLVYLRDADMVIGTRTTRQMIEQGSNMRGVVRWAHILLARLVELAWWRFDSRFTDVCCTYRALWRSTYGLIRDQLESDGVEIFPEVVIEVLRTRRRIVEIPINYYNRDVVYPYVRSPYQKPSVFLRILAMVLRKRWQEFGLARSVSGREDV